MAAGDPLALTVAARCLLPLVQVTPRGLWERGGQVALTTVEHWLGRSSAPVPAPDATVLRHLGVFGPASVNQSYGTVLVDGFFEAVWRVERDGDTANPTVHALRTLRRGERAEITEEAVRCRRR